MSDFALTLFTILNIGLALAFTWGWWNFRERLRQQDQKLAESLDDLDLVEFQENVQGLLQEVQRVGESLVQRATEREQGLQDLIRKAGDLQGQLETKLGAVKDQILSLEERSAGLPVKSAVPLPAQEAHSRETIAFPPVSAEAMPWARTASTTQVASSISRTPEGGGVRRRQSIYEMAEQGMGVEEIVRQTKLLRGEVELILSLRPIQPGEEKKDF